jgi:deoxynucleoside triphosphate triphosphohydrolase SAMHD1
VKVAGLCHDLGHGPFSHVFDGVFMTRMHPSKKLRHEDWSVMIFKHLLETNHINLSEYNLGATDKLFICEIISGTPESQRRGRSSDKFYLYDIVNNSRSGLDVDKLDYFQRDILYSNVDTSHNRFERFIEFGKVMCAEPINGSGNLSRASTINSEDSPIIPSAGSDNIVSSRKDLAYMICYPEKMVGEALQLFALRYHLHQQVYTHRTVKKVEYMVLL